MEVILLERVAKLGQMGEVVRVRDGFARNYLLPRGKALRATEANKKRFEGDRAQLEARNLEAKGEAEKVSAKLDGQAFVVIRSASDGGALYGSVTTRDVAEAATADGFSLDRRQVALNAPIKELGLHQVQVTLHPEVVAKQYFSLLPFFASSSSTRANSYGPFPDSRLPCCSVSSAAASEYAPPQLGSHEVGPSATTNASVTSWPYWLRGVWNS